MDEMRTYQKPDPIAATAGQEEFEVKEIYTIVNIVMAEKRKWNI